MGEWLKPNTKVNLESVLASRALALPAEIVSQLAVMLEETGLVVPTMYYVPDVNELFAMYRQLAELEYDGRMPRGLIRWVMCFETQAELHRRHGNTKTVHTPPMLASFIAGDEVPDLDTVSDQIHMVMTMRAAASIPAALDAGRLFDMPIRRDPAARRPMFELIPKAGARRLTRKAS